MTDIQAEHTVSLIKALQPFIHSVIVVMTAVGSIWTAGAYVEGLRRDLMTSIVQRQDADREAIGLLHKLIEQCDRQGPLGAPRGRADMGAGDVPRG